MELVQTSTVYSYILTEDEWYSGTVQQKEAWINEVLRKAEEAGARYASIFVNPDPIMSVSDKPQRHSVWKHTFPIADEYMFKSELEVILHYGVQKGLTRERMAAIAREVFKA